MAKLYCSDAAFIALVIAGWLMAPRLPAQTVEVHCPAMPVLKIRPGLWQAQKEVSHAIVRLPSGEVINFQEFDIPKTYVRGIFNRAVDPCTSTGRSSDGSILSVRLPREPIRGLLHPYAVAIQATGTLRRPSGEVWLVNIIYPDCPTRGTGPRSRIAAAVVAYGTISK